LVEIEPRAIGEAAGAAYALARRFAESPSPEAFVKKSGPDLRRMAASLHALFTGDALGGKGPPMGVALLEALAGARALGSGGDDFRGALVAYAAALYAKGEPDKADLCLLATLVLAAVSHQKPPAEAVALAASHQSRAAWALAFTEE